VGILGPPAVSKHHDHVGGEPTGMFTWEVVALIALKVGLALLAFCVISLFARLSIWLSDPSLERRTDKAKEKYADSLMGFGNTIQGAVFIAIFVSVPVLFLGPVILSGGEPRPFASILSWIGKYGYVVAILLGLWWLGLVYSSALQRRALNLYDQLSQERPSMGSHEGDQEKAPTDDA
jgi:hypothetical protein